MRGMGKGRDSGPGEKESSKGLNAERTLLLSPLAKLEVDCRRLAVSVPKHSFPTAFPPLKPPRSTASHSSRFREELQSPREEVAGTETPDRQTSVADDAGRGIKRHHAVKRACKGVGGEGEDKEERRIIPQETDMGHKVPTARLSGPWSPEIPRVFSFPPEGREKREDDDASATSSSGASVRTPSLSSTSSSRTSSHTRSSVAEAPDPVRYSPGYPNAREIPPRTWERIGQRGSGHKEDPSACHGGMVAGDKRGKPETMALSENVQEKYTKANGVPFESFRGAKGGKGDKTRKSLWRR